MMCDECGLNPATIHIATIIGGNKKDENLCKDCWQKRNAAMMGGLQMGELLAKLLGAKPEQNEQKTPEPEEALELYCDACGMSWNEFRKTGRVGCAHCYAVFGEHMEKTIAPEKGQARHTGKAPAHLAEEMTMQRQMEALKKQMEEAVQREDFELAATLRDSIRAISLDQVAKDMRKQHAQEVHADE